MGLWPWSGWFWKLWDFTIFPHSDIALWWSEICKGLYSFLVFFFFNLNLKSSFLIRFYKDEESFNHKFFLIVVFVTNLWSLHVLSIELFIVCEGELILYNRKAISTSYEKSGEKLLETQLTEPSNQRCL